MSDEETKKVSHIAKKLSHHDLRAFSYLSNYLYICVTKMADKNGL